MTKRKGQAAEKLFGYRARVANVRKATDQGYALLGIAQNPIATITLLAKVKAMAFPDEAKSPGDLPTTYPLGAAMPLHIWGQLCALAGDVILVPFDVPEGHQIQWAEVTPAGDGITVCVQKDASRLILGPAAKGKLIIGGR